MLAPGRTTAPPRARRLTDGVPQSGHAQTDFGRARVRFPAAPDRQELLPDRARPHGPDRRQALWPRGAATRGAAPDTCPERGALAEDAHVRAVTGDGAPDPVHRHERTGSQAGDDHSPDVDRPAIVDQPRGDLGDLLAGDVSHGIEHVGSRCRTGSRRRRLAGYWRHVRAVRTAQSCQTTASTLRSAPTSPLAIISGGGTDLRGEAAREGRRRAGGRFYRVAAISSSASPRP